MNKNFKIIGLRPSLIGDIITSLPILILWEKQYPNSYKTVSIAKKCSQCVSLLLNHPLIDRLHINELLENPNKQDQDFFNFHDISIPVNLQHRQWDWYNHRCMVEENFDMMGLDWNLLNEEERIPHLVKWFDIKKYNKTIALWPFAGYGRNNNRSPPSEWYYDFLKILFLSTDYKIFQFGSENDTNLNPNISNPNSDFTRFNYLSFFDQVKMTLGCDFMIGTDSGSSLVMAAYGFPQITLLTNWNLNHYQNFLALSPRNKNNINIISTNKFEDINIDFMLKSIKKIK